MKNQTDSPKTTSMSFLSPEIEKTLALYAKGLSDNNDVLWAEADFFMKHTQEALFQAGRRYIVLKERLGHGNWKQELKNRGLVRKERTIQRVMAITRKFANISALKYLNTGKLVLLLEVPDEEIQKVEETGCIFDIPVDEIAGMSDREFEKALKKADIQGRKKDKIIKDLRKQLKEWEKSEADLSAKDRRQLLTIHYASADILNARKRLKNIRPQNSSPEIQKEFFRVIKCLQNDLTEDVNFYQEVLDIQEKQPNE